jgi:CcmD family protein
MKFLYAAYLITWGVIVVYILTMVLGFRKVSNDFRDLEH